MTDNAAQGQRRRVVAAMSAGAVNRLSAAIPIDDDGGHGHGPDDMFIDLKDDPRENGPTLGDERTTLVEALRCARLTLEIKWA